MKGMHSILDYVAFEINKKRNFMKNTETTQKHLMIKVSLAILCAGLLLGLVVVQYVFRTFTTYRVVHQTEITHKGDYWSEKLGDNLLLYNNDGMRCIDKKGKVAWDITYQIKEPCTAVDGNTVAIAGYGENLIYIMNEEEKLGEINTNLPIRNLCVAEAGYVGAVLDDNDVYWVYIYDTKGTEVTRARTTMEQSGYPMSLDLSANGKLLGISYLYLDAATVQSNVAFYNLGEVGQNYTDQYMSGYIYQEIVPELHYMDKNTAMAISNGRLMIYEGAEKPTVLKEVLLSDTLLAAHWGDENVVLIYHGTAEQKKYFMQVYDTKGDLQLEKDFDMDYSDIKSQNGIITIYDSDEVLVYTLDGRERYLGGLGEPIRSIEPTSKKYRYMVLFEESFKIIELE